MNVRMHVLKDVPTPSVVIPAIVLPGILAVTVKVLTSIDVLLYYYSINF